MSTSNLCSLEKIGKNYALIVMKYNPRCEKTGLRGFRPGYRRWLEA